MKTASDVRCAFRRLGNAVLAGKIDPQRANSAAYCIAGASRALEIEVTEEAVRLARALRVQRQGQVRLVEEGELLDPSQQLLAAPASNVPAPPVSDEPAEMEGLERVPE